MFALREAVHEDGVVFDLDDLVPGDELGGFAPAVLDVDADSLGVRFAELKDEVGKLADAVLILPAQTGRLSSSEKKEKP